MMTFNRSICWSYFDIAALLHHAFQAHEMMMMMLVVQKLTQGTSVETVTAVSEGWVVSSRALLLATNNGKDVYLSYHGTYKLTHNKWLGSDQLNLRNACGEGGSVAVFYFVRVCLEYATTISQMPQLSLKWNNFNEYLYHAEHLMARKPVPLRHAFARSKGQEPLVLSRQWQRCWDSVMLRLLQSGWNIIRLHEIQLSP
jgi:hypothetical protein